MNLPVAARRLAGTACVAVLALTGCDGGSPPREAAPPAAGPAAGQAAGECARDGATLTATPPSPTASPTPTDEIVLAAPSDEGHVRQRLVDEWNHTHTPRARLVELPFDTDRGHAQLTAAAQNGFPQYDVVLLDVPWIAEFAQAGFIRPLGDEFDQEDFFSKPWNAGCYRGQLYAVPFNTDVGLLFARTDLQVTTPDSWENIPSSVRDRDTGRAEFGMVTQLRDYEGLTVNALEAIWSAGGDVHLDGGPVLDARARAGLTALVRAVVGGNNAVGSPTFDETSSRAAFAAGHAAFMRNWPNNYDLLPARGLPFEVRPLPWPSVLGGQSLAVSSTSRDPAAAVDLIRFLTNPDSEQQLFDEGGLPAARRGVYADSTRPYAPLVAQGIEAARPRPAIPHYAEFSEAMRQALTPLLSASTFDRTEVDAALDRLDRRLAAAVHGRTA